VQLLQYLHGNGLSKYKDDGNARSTQVKHRQQNALNHKAQNLFYTGLKGTVETNKYVCQRCIYELCSALSKVPRYEEDMRDSVMSFISSSLGYTCIKWT
jgi:hypothetical protein